MENRDNSQEWVQGRKDSFYGEYQNDSNLLSEPERSGQL